MERWAGKVAVVTGASSGIGLATAQAFVRKGLVVVGLARRKSAMEKGMKNISGPGKFYAKECDISSEESVNKIFDWVQSTLGTVHILINNAGVLKQGAIDDLQMKEMQFVINVNLMGLLYCSKRAIRLMKTNGEEGYIVNINSVAGFQTSVVPGQYYNVYSSTKFAVRSLSETFAHELNNTKIRVTNISPGVVKTDIFEGANMDTTFLQAVPVLLPEDIANTIMYVIGVPQHIRICELTVKPTGDVF